MDHRVRQQRNAGARGGFWNRLASYRPRCGCVVCRITGTLGSVRLRQLFTYCPSCCLLCCFCDSPLQVSFAYASPVVTGLSCTPNGTLATTTGGSVCTVFGNNLALTDIATGQGSGLAVLFGNPSDNSVHAQAIRASLVPRPDSDLTTVTPYLPGRVQFAVPAGMGVGRAVRLVSFRSGDPFPTPSFYTTSPVPATQACMYSAASPLGCVDSVDVYSYAAPSIAGVVVTLLSTAEQITLATSQFGQNAVVSGSVRVVSLSGTCSLPIFILFREQPQSVCLQDQISGPQRPARAPHL